MDTGDFLKNCLPLQDRGNSITKFTHNRLIKLSVNCYEFFEVQVECLTSRKSFDLGADPDHDTDHRQLKEFTPSPCVCKFVCQTFYLLYNIFHDNTGSGYDTFLLYPRPITLAKSICGFVGIIAITCLIKLIRFLYLIFDVFIPFQLY